MQDRGNLGRQFVSMGLIRILSILAPELLFAQNRGQLGALGRRGGIVSRDCSVLLGSRPGSGNARISKTRKARVNPRFNMIQMSSVSMIVTRIAQRRQ